MSSLKKIKKYLPFKSLLDGFYRKLEFIFLNKTALNPHEIKDFEFWNYLGKLLISIKPEAILELGAGKSSLLLSDYAFKRENIIYESVEQNIFYVRKLKKALNNSFLASHYIKYVPLVNGWYDISKIKDINYDFIFVDGPTAGILNKNPRSNQIAVNFLKRYIDNCKFIIFDDVQRQSELELVQNLQIDEDIFEFIDINCYKYYPDTRLRIYYKPEYREIIMHDALVR